MVKLGFTEPSSVSGDEKKGYNTTLTEVPVFDDLYDNDANKALADYGNLPQAEVNRLSQYTADFAWAHTDTETVINMQPWHPYSTLNHELEHWVARIYGLSQDENRIQERAEDPDRKVYRDQVRLRGMY